nr:sulfurtransferase TusA family protein [Aureimonas sp. SK2]
MRGLKCPLPAIRTERALARLAAGHELTVLADDPLARLDIAHLCRAGGHALLSVEAVETGGWAFSLRRGDVAER